MLQQPKIMAFMQIKKTKLRFFTLLDFDLNDQDKKDKKIEVIKNWLELKLFRDIKIFLGFVNIHKIFIRNFGKTAEVLNLML